ncbi:hypothetical protein D7B24_006045 [Verticillium nonalfalfae]|uniref:PRELI/MSF1 domain-containing protein n=1 Tax=Verticillium nonalfalfae TaxID=1051616 RepID=A0A3M9YBT3_9PEZI|nr:uncharacterized protein D7B24_006045 [Verticillium nonalfalfae]RNJ57432.1 hypothetical protein D7B24_006045 [Verticillium nonalfalfae]
MVLTHTTNHAYSHPFPAVTLAYFLRYSSPKLNPFSTHVMSTDTINSHIDPDTGRLHTTRIHLKKSRLPAPIFKLLPTSITGGGSSTDKASYILETSVVDMREGWMRTESRNLNFNNVLSVVEQQNFSLPDTTDPADPTATTNVTTTVVYKSRLGERLRARRDQSASSSAAAATTATAEPKEGKWLSGWVSGLGARGIQRSIENIASSKTEAQIGKSREGMRVVLERLRHTGVGGVLEMMRRERQLA